MSSGLQADLARMPSRRFAAVADDARVMRTSAVLEGVVLVGEPLGF